MDEFFCCVDLTMTASPGIQVRDISNERNCSFRERKSEVDLEDSPLTAAEPLVPQNGWHRASEYPAHSGHNSKRLQSEANH